MDDGGNIFGADGNPIMTCGPYAIDGTEESYGNARLIAAAPDLLAVCQEILPGLEALCTLGVENIHLKHLRAAIKKAEGTT